MPTLSHGSPNAVPNKPTALQASTAASLIYNAVDAAERLRYTLQAYEGLEWLLSFSPDESAPPPEQLGALVNAVNQASLACMGKLDATLAELRAAMPAAELTPESLSA
ncbi:hypothetical protein ACFIQF_19480 [Comamonas sp. J-3]|uniref:hypothetical protein n=1 Tax=Comamonas trifloxystrobinivorans TaxID=3350256 RepID=UPI0037289444